MALIFLRNGFQVPRFIHVKLTYIVYVYTVYDFTFLCSLVNPHAENYNFATDTFTYPTWWLESVGYWGQPGSSAPGRKPQPVYPFNTLTEKSQEDYDKKFPHGPYVAYPARGSTDQVDSQLNSGIFKEVAILFVGLCLGVIVTALYFRNSAQYAYARIP